MRQYTEKWLKTSLLLWCSRFIRQDNAVNGRQFLLDWAKTQGAIRPYLITINRQLVIMYEKAPDKTRDLLTSPDPLYLPLELDYDCLTFLHPSAIIQQLQGEVPRCPPTSCGPTTSASPSGASYIPSSPISATAAQTPASLLPPHIPAI
mgnify:CR=1 FL=1